eukprot:5915218-Prymnesium_polylepis.2
MDFVEVLVRARLWPRPFTLALSRCGVAVRSRRPKSRRLVTVELPDVATLLLPWTTTGEPRAAWSGV